MTNGANDLSRNNSDSNRTSANKDHKQANEYTPYRSKKIHCPRILALSRGGGATRRSGAANREMLNVVSALPRRPAA